MQRDTIEKNPQRIILGINNQEPEPDTNTPPREIQDIYVLIIREREGLEGTPFAVESTHLTLQKTSFLPAYAVCGLYLFGILATLLFQLYCIYNPPIATVTIIPKSQQVILSGTVQLGRVLPPLTISQSQTMKATGTGHQDATQATGTVTFYNGLFTQQFVARGTVYTGADGVAIVTKQDAPIPPGNPSAGYGTTTVPAQALQAGKSGNMQAGDVSITINNGLLVSNNQFSGGQNARTYTTVTHNDIHKLSTVLITSLAASLQGALLGQLKSNEQLQVLPCMPTVTSDHQIGEEATTVKVTVSQTCIAVAYNRQVLATEASAFLTSLAHKKTGSGYSLFGTVRVSVRQASVANAPHPVVFLSFQTQGTWIYALSQSAQQQIKHLVAGKTTQQAATLLAALPGVKHAAIHLSGFGDTTRLPKQSSYIHVSLFLM